MRFHSSGIGFIVGISLLAASVAARAGATSPDPVAPADGKQFVKHTFSPKSVGMAAAGAAVNQANDTPHEWGQGAAGFGKRFSSAYGKHIVHKAIQYPVSRLLHEEFGYHRSDKTGFGPRLKAALVGTVMTHKTTTGKRTVAVGEISGAVGSGLVSRLWQPASTGTMAAGFTSGGITLGIDTGMNVVKEFWPEIRHPRKSAHVRGANKPLVSASNSTQPASSQTISTELSSETSGDQ